MDRKGKVLVTGASGFLGRSLIQKLFLQEGMQIVGLVRNPKTARGSLPKGIELIQGDITDRHQLPSFPSDVDAVIHAAGMLGTFLAKDSLYRLVNTTGTENVLCASESAGIRNFLLVSSAGVLGPIKNPPADESMPRSPSNGYERSKAEAEEITERFHREGRIRAIIVRPEFIYGPGDLHLLNFFRSIRDRKFFLIGSGDSLLHPTYIEDVSQAIWAVITHGGFNGLAYLVTGPRYMTVRELYQIIASALGVPIRRIRLPEMAAYSAAGLLEIAGRAIGKDMPLTFSKVRFFTENRAFKSDRATTAFNYVPRVSFEEGVAETVKWYRDRGLL